MIPNQAFNAIVVLTKAEQSMAKLSLRLFNFRGIGYIPPPCLNVIIKLIFSVLYGFVVVSQYAEILIFEVVF